MSRQLPSQPHIDVLRKQAKRLLTGYESGEQDAVARVQAELAQLPPSASEDFSLRQAQQVLAREYGFSSWQALCDHVGVDGGGRVVWSERHRHYDKLVADLVAAVRTGEDGAFGVLGQRLRTRLTDAGIDSGDPEATAVAQLVVAQASGSDSWAALHEKAVEPVPGIVDREQMRALENMHQELAAFIAADHNATAGNASPIQVDIAFVDQTSFGEVLISLTQGTRVVVLQGGRPDADLFACLSPALMSPELTPGRDREQVAQAWETRIAAATGRLLGTADGEAAALQARHGDRFSALEHAPMYEIGVLVALEVGPATQGEWTPGLVELFYPVRWIARVLDDSPEPS